MKHLKLYENFSEVLEFNQSTRQITNSLVTSWITNQNILENELLATVGNSIHRDDLDALYLSNYNFGQGGFGYHNIPSKTPTSRPATYDTDRDGMADAWEQAVFGDLSKNPSDDVDGDGYTNIETFLFSLK